MKHAARTTWKHPVGRVSLAALLIFGALAGLVLGVAYLFGISERESAHAQMEGVPLVRYYLDEADSGQVPTEVVDTAGSPLNLPIIYSGADPSYAELATGRGLEWATINTSARVELSNVDGTKVKNQIHGASKVTVEFVVRAEDARLNDSRVFQIGDDTNRRLSIQLGTTDQQINFRWHPSGGTQGTTAGVWNNAWTVGERAVYHVVLDTTLATAGDRVRLYRGGQLLTKSSGTDPSQNSTIDLQTGSMMTLGNSPNSTDRAIQGFLGYIAVYDDALSGFQADANASVLAANDDPEEASEGTQYFTDFSEYTTGAQPSDWTVRFNADPTWVVREDAGATGGKTLRAEQDGSVGAINAERMLSWDAIDADAARDDVEIVARLRTTSLRGGAARHAGLAGRASGTEGSDTKYQAHLLELDSDPVATLLRKTASGSGVDLGNDSQAWTAGTWYFIRIRIEGTSLKLRRWSGTTEDEPATWDVEVTDADISGVGWVGAMFRRHPNDSGNTDFHEWDFIGVGTGGLSAPTADPGTPDPPVLSNATGAETSTSTASGSVTTDVATGTLYWVVTQSTTTPSAAQIKAGQNDGGTTADDSGSQAVSATGAQNVSATGLTAETSYYFHFVQTDQEAQDSNTITSNQFTTNAEGGGVPGDGVMKFLTSSGSANIDHDAAFNTNAFEIRVDAALATWTPSTQRNFMQRWSGTVPHWQWRLSSSNINLLTADDNHDTDSGTFIVYNASWASGDRPADGERAQLRVVFEPTESRATFYIRTGADIDDDLTSNTGWTSIGSGTGAANRNWTGVTQSIRLRGRLDLLGDWRKAVMWSDNSQTTKILDLDFTNSANAVTPGVFSEWNDGSSANTWTMQGIEYTDWEYVERGLTQIHYRWYENRDDITPVTGLALEDTPATGISTNDVVRLRMSVRVDNADLAAGETFKLQYSTATSSGWEDVGGVGSGRIWRGYDNASVADGATLKDTLLTHSGRTMTYEEQNNSAGTPFDLPVAATTLGQDWTEATSGAGWTPRGGHTSVVHDNKLWVTGGADSLGGSLKNDVWYSTNGAAWTQATSGAAWVARYGHASVVFDDKMWIMGGAGTTYYNDVWYSTNGAAWTQATSGAPWTGRWSPTVAVFDNKMWIMGGLDGSGNCNGSGSSRCRDVWHSTDGVNWTEVTSAANWSARHGHSSVVYDNKMWVFGGQASAGRLNDVWYSTNGAAWTQATSGAAWAIRSGHTSVVYEEKMWIMAGAGSGTGTCNTVGMVRCNDVWHSGNGVDWTQATNSAGWVPRAAPSSAVYDNKLWILGGEQGAESDNCNGSGVPECRDVWYSNGNGAGEWDWVLQNNGAAGETTYYFRMVRADGTTLDYSVYPTLATAVVDPVLTQIHYRWYENRDDITPVTALALEDTSVSEIAENDVVRLRMSVRVDDEDLAAGETFKLQYSTATSSGWADVGGVGSGAIWRGYNNPGVADGATIPYMLLTHSGHTMTYEEANNSAATPFDLPVTATLGSSWTEATSSAAWMERNRHTSLVYDNKMWIFGGIHSTSTNLSDVWYSTNGINWTLAASSTGWGTRRNHVSVVFDDKMWVIGGKSPAEEFNNDVWYSTDGINWTEATSSAAWDPRGYHAAVVFDNKMWIMGGSNESGNCNGSGSSRCRDVWHSSDGIHWIEAVNAAAWGGKETHGALVHDNKMWVIGGWAGSGPGHQNDVWYSTNGSAWIEATSSAPWDPRAYLAPVAYDEKMWIMGGQGEWFTDCNGSGESFCRDVWYSSDGINWTEAIQIAPWQRRDAHTSLVYDNQIWVIGGRIGSGAIGFNDVWYSQGSGAGEWDWVLQNNGAAGETTYYFRMVRVDGTVLDSYRVYPTLTTGGEPFVNQIHYRWRNDDGNEENATFMIAEDTAISNVLKNTNVRLRTQIVNTGSVSSSASEYVLEYASMTGVGSCGAVASSSWTVIPAVAASEHWQMGPSTFLTTDGATTTNVTIGGGLTDAGSVFVPGYIFDESNQTPQMILDADHFTELEHSIKPTANAVSGDTYCFRIVNAPLDGYSVYPQATIAAGAASGTLESSTFDTRSGLGAQMNSIIWHGTLPPDTSVRFQIAGSNDPGGPWNFYGAGCDTEQWYSPAGPGLALQVHKSCHNNFRYFRYKIRLEADPALTASPRVEQVILNWSP